DGAQIVEVLGAGAFQPALVRRKQGLPDARRRLLITVEQRSDLFDHVGERDPMGQTVAFDLRRAELRATRFVDLLSDLGRGPAGGEAPGPDAPRPFRFPVLSA